VIERVRPIEEADRHSASGIDAYAGYGRGLQHVAPFGPFGRWLARVGRSHI